MQCDQRAPDQMGGHRVAVSRDADQTFAVDLHTLEETVVVGEGRQGTKLQTFVGQQLRGRLVDGVGGAHVIAVLEPRRAVLVQLGSIIEGPPDQEVAFDELEVPLFTLSA